MPAETHSHHAPLDRGEVFSNVADRLGEILQIDSSSIKDTDSLSDDLHADSLALFELIEMLEDEFGERSVGLGVELDTYGHGARHQLLDQVQAITVATPDIEYPHRTPQVESGLALQDVPVAPQLTLVGYLSHAGHPPPRGLLRLVWRGVGVIVRVVRRVNLGDFVRRGARAEIVEPALRALY